MRGRGESCIRPILLGNRKVYDAMTSFTVCARRWFTSRGMIFPLIKEGKHALEDNKCHGAKNRIHS